MANKPDERDQDILLSTAVAAFENLSEDEFGYVYSDFLSMDGDGSGKLSRKEVVDFLVTDSGCSEADVTEYMKQYDKDNDNSITLIEFLMASGYSRTQEMREEIAP